MKITPEQIIEIVCEHFNITAEEVKRNIRKVELVRPRQVCYYLLKQNTRLKLSEMADLMKGRKTYSNDHTTLLHSFKVVNDLMDTEPLFRSQVMQIQIQINNANNELMRRHIVEPEKAKEPIKAPEKRREVVFSEAEKVVNKYL
jgi:chromosomal replication initiator protein